MSPLERTCRCRIERDALMSMQQQSTAYEQKGKKKMVQEKERQMCQETREEQAEQRRRLREFDKELFSYTGQIAWLLPGFFAFAVLGLMCIPVQEVGSGDTYLIIVTYLSGFWISFCVLQPYVNTTDTFERSKNKRNRTYDKLKYLPVSRKQYISVRMGYLFRYLWKLTLAGGAVQCIFAAVDLGRVEPVNVAYAVGVLLLIPLVSGWIQLWAGTAWT